MSGKKQVVNVHEAKTHFSKLLQRVERGDEVTIAKAGKPVARLVPIAEPPKRQLGMDVGKDFYIAPDFDAPDEDLIALFENSSIDPDR